MTNLVELKLKLEETKKEKETADTKRVKVVQEFKDNLMAMLNHAQESGICKFDNADNVLRVWWKE